MPHSVWPDLTKFRHFGKKIKSINFCRAHLGSIWQNFEPTLAKFQLPRYVDKSLSLQMTKYWKNNLVTLVRVACGETINNSVYNEAGTLLQLVQQNYWMLFTDHCCCCLHEISLTLLITLHASSSFLVMDFNLLTYGVTAQGLALKLAPWHLVPSHLAPWHLAPWHLAPWHLIPWTLGRWEIPLKWIVT